MRALRTSSPRISRSVRSIPRLSQRRAVGACASRGGPATTRAMPPLMPGLVGHWPTAPLATDLAGPALSGLVAGWGVAVPLGAIGVLLVDLGMRAGLRRAGAAAPAGAPPGPPFPRGAAGGGGAGGAPLPPPPPGAGPPPGARRAG